MDNTTTMTPKEIDTQLADLWYKESIRLNEIARLKGFLKKEPTGYYADDHAKRLRTVETEARAIRLMAEPFEAEFNRRPWKRYFLVPAGHVHRGRNCTTCYPTTEYGWLPELSGCDEIEMVKAYGELACTVCFPDAPSMYQMLGGAAAIKTKADVAREEREAKKAAAAAKKAEKAIVNPDGSVLKGTDWRIDTVYTAWQQLVDLTETLTLRNYHEGSYVAQNIEKYEAALERIAVALAHKLGKSVEEIKATAVKKAKAR